MHSFKLKTGITFKAKKTFMVNDMYKRQKTLQSWFKNQNIYLAQNQSETKGFLPYPTMQDSLPPHDSTKLRTKSSTQMWLANLLAHPLKAHKAHILLGLTSRSYKSIQHRKQLKHSDIRQKVLSVN